MLALHGGQPVVTTTLEPYNSIGSEEIEAAVSVLQTGKLSGFLAKSGPQFLGGPHVRQLESKVAAYVGVKHAISVNSWTSGLICSIGALDLEPGDEVITSPWTMCATATSILHFNCIPVFADIDPLTFNLCPASVAKRISPRTKAILAVDIFGLSCDVSALSQLAKQNNLAFITDSAQSPLATVDNQYAGTLSDIGGYSFNSHKHIQTGEGGLLFTNSDIYARRMQLLRNHAEACLLPGDSRSNMVGYNFRLGELEAAIALQQFIKLPNIVSQRQHFASQLTEGLATLPGLITPYIPQGYTHAYYVYPLIIDSNIYPGQRQHIVDALSAEGVPVISGYTNIHLLPMFQEKQAYGSSHFPWSLNEAIQYDYSPGTLPIAEKLHNETFICLGLCNHHLTPEIITEFITAFHKVWSFLPL